MKALSYNIISVIPIHVASVIITSVDVIIIISLVIISLVQVRPFLEVFWIFSMLENCIVQNNQFCDCILAEHVMF